jgi:hypothetical protein
MRQAGVTACAKARISGYACCRVCGSKTEVSGLAWHVRFTLQEQTSSAWANMSVWLPKGDIVGRAKNGRGRQLRRPLDLHHDLVFACRPGPPRLTHSFILLSITSTSALVGILQWLVGLGGSAIRQSGPLHFRADGCAALISQRLGQGGSIQSYESHTDRRACDETPC